MQTMLRKELKISAAHHLPKHKGKCFNDHGHNYLIEVFARGELDDGGMVIDFYDMSTIMKQVIDLPCDHKDLNEVYPEMDTTAENLSRRWLTELRQLDDRIFRVRVWETDTAYAESEAA
jgi:6-pyruvoyltetrahydropterin/6-carboxytetrahydropterin synthase